MQIHKSRNMYIYTYTVIPNRFGKFSVNRTQAYSETIPIHSNIKYSHGNNLTFSMQVVVIQYITTHIVYMPVIAISIFIRKYEQRTQQTCGRTFGLFVEHFVRVTTSCLLFVCMYSIIYCVN